MSIQPSLLFKSLVLSFYRQYAALFCFVYFIMFLSVGRANGVGLLEYHFALIQGMLLKTSFLLLVFAIWLAYGLRCIHFIMATLNKPPFSYLYLSSQLPAGRLYWLLLQVQLMLFLPILSYLVAIVGVGYRQHWYATANLSVLYLLLLCVISAGWYWYLLRHPGIAARGIRWKQPAFLQRRYYAGFLVRFIAEKNKLLFLAIKAYNCCTLYLMLNDRNPAAHDDIRMEVLFFTMGMLGHGVLIYRLKEMENTGLSFYRGLPVTLTRRLAQYACCYFFIFVPELLTIITRVPAFLTYTEAVFFACFGYGMLLLLNSIQLFNYTSLKDALATVVQILFAVIVAMIGRQLYVLPVLFWVLAIVIFYKRYYLFEATQSTGSRP
jgi:hypothetical protein